MPYQYHTVAMEWLPHEVRFLYDSVVVSRLPDRMIAPGDPYYQWVEGFGRAPVNVIPGEIDADDNLAAPSYTERWFLAHVTSTGKGYWNNAAHHRIDYIKIWDVPKDVIIPGFPH